jgi:hypothetical protein
MALEAKTKLHSKSTGRYRQNGAVKVPRDAGEPRAADRFMSPGRTDLRSRGARKKPDHEKARLATFSLTPEDLLYVEKANYQVIQALKTGVSKSHTVRLAMRAFASMSMEELRTLLHRILPFPNRSVREGIWRTKRHG